MAHRFDLAALQATDIATCSPGFMWRLWPRVGPANLILKLNSGNPRQLLFVQLSGEQKFRVTTGQMPAPDSTAFLPVHASPLKIELPDVPLLGDDREALGSVVVCREGAFLVTQEQDGNGFPEIVYVSLQEFAAFEHLPSQQSGVFTTWRLTTSETDPAERTVLLSHGNWP